MKNKPWRESTTNPVPVLRIAASRGFSELTNNVTSSSGGHSKPSLKISRKSVQLFPRNVADKQTKKSIENSTPSTICRGRGNNTKIELVCMVWRSVNKRRRRGRQARGLARAPPPKKKIGKIFFGQLLCKICAFSGKNHVKFGNFVNFSGKYHKNSGILIIFDTYFSGKNVMPPKVD